MPTQGKCATTCVCECVHTGPFCRVSSSLPPPHPPCLLLTNTLTRYDHKKLTRKVAAVATVVAVVDCCMSARATHLTAASAAVAADVAGVSLSLLNDEQSDTFSIPNQLDGRQ